MDFPVLNDILMGFVAIHLILDPLEQFNLAIVYSTKLGSLLYVSNFTVMLFTVLFTILFYLTVLQQIPIAH